MAPKRTLYKGILFRSAAEAELAKELDSWGPDLEWAYEDDTFTYNVVLTRKYTLDFRVTPLDTNQVFYVEYKGRLTLEDRKKLLRVKEQYPDLDLRLVFQRNQPIRKGSKTTYEDWAIKHGFPVAIGGIPKEWIYGTNTH